MGVNINDINRKIRKHLYISLRTSVWCFLISYILNNGMLVSIEVGLIGSLVAVMIGYKTMYTKTERQELVSIDFWNDQINRLRE